MPRVLQSINMKCVICGKGDLIFILDQDLGPKEPDVVLQIRCVPMNTAEQSKCQIQTGGRLFNMLVEIYRLGTQYAADIEAINLYSRKLHHRYVAQTQYQLHYVYAEIKQVRT